MIAFVVGQLFINYKHGVVASPLFHYGMYSEVMKTHNSYGVFEVVANGKVLAGKDFTPQQWDKILVPLRYYAQLNNVSNKLFYTDIKRLMNAAHLAPNEQQYAQECDAGKFMAWYKPYLSKIVNRPVENLNVRYRLYAYKEKRLAPTDSLLTLSQLCP
jgi:hypothetical protein